MTKLKCGQHKRRVIVLESGKQVHRTGDNSSCMSDSLFMGKREVSAGAAWFQEKPWSTRDTPAEKLLREIFSKRGTS